MTTPALVMELRRRGVVLEAHGNQLVVDGPAAQLTDQTCDELRQRKAELLAYLSAEAGDQPAEESAAPRATEGRGAEPPPVDDADKPTPRERQIIGWLRDDPLPAPMSHAPATFRFSAGLLAFGDIPAGWTPAAWATELKRKAHRCRDLHMDTAAYYTHWADDIERRLGPPARPARSALGGGCADKKQR